MGHSKLATYVSLSPNHSGRRTHKVDTLTPHYMAGDLTVETCASIFKPTSRKASSNYGIGSDGRIGVYVEEENRAWTSGSAANDQRAITFECANLKDGSLTQKCWDSLVALCADICRRYGYKGVYYCGKADYSRLPSGYMLLTMHKWFQNTDCPGPWLSKQFDRLAKEVNAYLGGEAPEPEGLDVDGDGGPETVTDWQEQMGTPVDGEVSGQDEGNAKWWPAMSAVKTGKGGSQLVRAVQEAIGAEPDSHWGRETTMKLQRKLLDMGYDIGPFDADCVKALQRSLNDERWKK